MRRFLSLSVIAFVCACASKSPQQALAPDVVYSTGSFQVAPGEDVTMCTYVRGTNDEPVDVSSFVSDQETGGHHIIVYAVDHPVDLPPAPCTQGGQPGWDTLLISQEKHEQVRFPEGVGYRIAPHQQFVIETHFINASAAPVSPKGTFGLFYAPMGTVKDRAATYYFGTMNIDVLPNGKSTSVGTCSPPVPMTAHTMFGHQHRMGSLLTAQLLPAGGAPKDLYKSTDWEHAPIVDFDGGLQVGVNDKLSVTCEWDNTGHDRLRYPREMCFAIGYQWPADTGFTCVSGGGSDQCTCFPRGNLNVGAGGGAIELNVKRAASVPAAGGPLDAGDGIYCFLYLPEDIGPAGPKPGARPRYFRDAQGAVLATAGDTATIPIGDVTPGTYLASCMMDVVGGGFVPGPGDIVNSAPAPVTVQEGATSKVDVQLDFALP